MFHFPFVCTYSIDSPINRKNKSTQKHFIKPQTSNLKTKGKQPNKTKPNQPNKPHQNLSSTHLNMFIHNILANLCK